MYILAKRLPFFKQTLGKRGINLLSLCLFSAAYQRDEGVSFQSAPFNLPGA